MPVVLVGIILLFADPNIGIFVIVLGVMVWTSGKSRRTQRRNRNKPESWIVEPRPERRPGAGIVAVHTGPRPGMAPRNDLSRSRLWQ